MIEFVKKIPKKGNNFCKKLRNKIRLVKLIQDGIKYLFVVSKLVGGSSEQVRGLHQVGWILQIEIELFVSVEFHNFEQEIHLLESLKVWLWEIDLATKNF